MFSKLQANDHVRSDQSQADIDTGWNAPRKSLLLVHPSGLGSEASNEEINISFDPVPDYAGIAKAVAGGNLFAAKIRAASEI